MVEGNIKEEIEQILRGSSHYGAVPIKKQLISRNVIWVGSPGHTASVGQWIRLIDSKLKESLCIRQGFRWFCHVNEEQKGRLPNDHMWYFGVTLLKPFKSIKGQKMGSNVTYVCSGCTDFSGEGIHGKELADAFLKMIMHKSLIITRNADYLISMLVSPP